MTPEISPFYLIVGDTSYLAPCLEAGVRTVQLRIKAQSDDVIRSEIRTAQRLCADNGATLIVNDYWQHALELGCKWVHLGQEDLETANIGALRQAGVKLGISTHDTRERQRAQALNPDYIALGPIYETKLKKMNWAPQGLDKITQWKGALGCTPLVAIGGLTPERAPAVLAAGADSIAVVTDIMTATDPASRCRQWLATIKGNEHVPL